MSVSAFSVYILLLRADGLSFYLASAHDVVADSLELPVDAPVNDDYFEALDYSLNKNLYVSPSPPHSPSARPSSLPRAGSSLRADASSREQSMLSTPTHLTDAQRRRNAAAISRPASSSTHSARATPPPAVRPPHRQTVVDPNDSDTALRPASEQQKKERRSIPPTLGTQSQARAARQMGLRAPRK